MTPAASPIIRVGVHYTLGRQTSDKIYEVRADSNHNAMVSANELLRQELPGATITSTVVLDQ